jgi:hypothetical protein
MNAAQGATIQFGSFLGRLRCANQTYTNALALVFGVGLRPLDPALDAKRQFELDIVDAPPTDRSAADGAPKPGAENLLTLGGTPSHPTITTEVLHAALDLESTPYKVTFTVLPNELTFPALCVHFGVIVHKMLFYFDRLMLHAAAVQIGNEVCLFVGDKGAGKSTTTLSLAKAGGTVLGEDQVVLWRTNGKYIVSGSDERSRVTERTERHFFDAPLPVMARDFAGTMKKEIAMRDYFRSRPFEDCALPPTRLIFPKVTGQFELRPLKSQIGLRRMIAYNGHFQRFAGPRDQAQFLDFLARFVNTVSCWDLTLSDDLTQLNKLAEMLQQRA